MTKEFAVSAEHSQTLAKRLNARVGFGLLQHRHDQIFPYRCCRATDGGQSHFRGNERLARHRSGDP